VYFTSKSAISPSGPSVLTKNFPFFLKNRVMTGNWPKRASPKSPRTVSSVAGCMARSWCEPVHCSCCSGWQRAQAALVTKPGSSASVGAAAHGASALSGVSAASQANTAMAAASNAIGGFRRDARRSGPETPPQPANFPMRRMDLPGRSAQWYGSLFPGARWRRGVSPETLHLL
jgi:hypothetical protein